MFCRFFLPFPSVQGENAVVWSHPIPMKATVIDNHPPPGVLLFLERDSFYFKLQSLCKYRYSCISYSCRSYKSCRTKILFPSESLDSGSYYKPSTSSFSLCVALSYCEGHMCIMNVWISPAFREIDLVDEVIYCILMPVISSTQMEIALRFDSILRIATGALNVHTLLFPVPKNALFRFPRHRAAHSWT